MKFLLVFKDVRSKRNVFRQSFKKMFGYFFMLWHILK